MKAQLYGSSEITAQLVVQLESENDIEKALLEALDGHVTTFRGDGDYLEAKLSIGEDND